MLDKLTLHAQLVQLNKNAASLDAAIAEKTRALEQAQTDLILTRGARQYHDMIVQQIKVALAELDAQAAAAPTTSPPPRSESQG